MLHINLKNTLSGDGKQCPEARTTNFGPPQSLGELCLELNEDIMRFQAWHASIAGLPSTRVIISHVNRAFQARALRRALYHRRDD